MRPVASILRIASLSAFFIVGWFGVSIVAAQTIPTNTDVLRSALSAAVDSVAIGQNDKRIYVETLLPPDVKTWLLADLLRKGYEVAADPGESTLRVRFEPSVRFLFRRSSKRTASRTADGQISSTLIAPDGNVIAAKLVPLSYADVVGPDPSSVDDGTWSWSAFSEIERGQHGFFQKIAEPALIATAVTVTIYLLFNVRSQ